MQKIGKARLYKSGSAAVRASQGPSKIENFRDNGSDAAAGKPGCSFDAVVKKPLVFTDDFSDETAGTSPDYWLEKNTEDRWLIADQDGNLVYGQESCALPHSDTWLHVFETNVDFTAKMKVTGIVSGQSRSGLSVRMTAADAYVRIGYDFAQSKWYLANRKGLDFDEQIIYAQNTSELPADTWVTVRVLAVGKTVEAYCNNVLVLQSSAVQQVTTGRVGLFAEYAQVWFDDISLSLLSGQGRVEKAALAQYILPKEGYVEGASLFWISDQVALINVYNDLYISEDQGQTFRKTTDEEYARYRFFAQSERSQYIRLHTGNILKLDNYTGGKAYLSTDDGATCFQAGRLWDESGLEKNWEFYGGMNDMVKEVRLSDGSYRVFYCADVRAYGNPEGAGKGIYHWEEIYYSDDEGHTWQKSKVDTRMVSALNHICESRIVACRDGGLRMYCTWNDSNSMRYFESHDDGVTWKGEYAIPRMRCARSSHALMEDPYDPGTAYMVFVYCEPGGLGSPLPRTRLSLVRSTDGRNWEYLMDAWRWDDVPDDGFININQIVDPSITVTKDYIFVLSGWSESSGSTYHQSQREHILKLKKSDLISYEQWPDTYEIGDKEIVHIQASAPYKILYRQNEALDLTGGILTIHYYDGTTETISMTDPEVTCCEPDLSVNYTNSFDRSDMSVTGRKLLRVTYRTFSANFAVRVVDEQSSGIPADYDVLDSLLDYAPPHEQDRYTKESQRIYLSALRAARILSRVLLREEQDRVSTAAANLRSAIKGLVPKKSGGLPK